MDFSFWHEQKNPVRTVANRAMPIQGFRVYTLRIGFLTAAACCVALGQAKLPPREVADLNREGYGALAKGGTGGRVVWVTNLKDSGEGSLRTALALKEPRIVKFKVGGVIPLKERILVQSGRVTIDGLSAAAQGGITIHGGLAFSNCEDVIVRHIRSRGGYDTLGLYGCRRVLIDHVSTAWAIDENTDVWGSHEVTLAWCIIAEGLAEGHDKGPHSMGSLQAGGSTRVTTHHCLFTGNLDRNPIIAGPTGKPKLPLQDHRFDVINNVIYNYWNSSKFSGYTRINFMGNYFRPGPDSSLGKPEINIIPKHTEWEGVKMAPKVFVQGNLGPRRKSAEDDELALVVIYGKANKGQKYGLYGPEARQYIEHQPFATPSHAQMTVQDAKKAYTEVLAHAGAWPRDAVDARLIREVKEKKGAIGRVGPRWRKIYEEFQKKQREKK